MRGTREVLEAHLALRAAGDLERDLAENYAADGVRRLAGVLRSYVAAGTYTYDRLVVAGEMGMLRWRARDGATHLDHGVDSYVVRDGRIVAQTIAYAITED